MWEKGIEDDYIFLTWVTESLELLASCDDWEDWSRNSLLSYPSQKPGHHSQQFSLFNSCFTVLTKWCSWRANFSCSSCLPIIFRLSKTFNACICTASHTLPLAYLSNWLLTASSPKPLLKPHKTSFHFLNGLTEKKDFFPLNALTQLFPLEELCFNIWFKHHPFFPAFSWHSNYFHCFAFAFI